MRMSLFVLLLACGDLPAADFQVGLARVNITPPTPFWLSGYAARTNPAPIVLQDLWAKALAVRDPRGHQAVLVTTDLIGLPRDVSDAVAARAKKRFKLDRADLLLNCSHTHSGPAVGHNLRVMFTFNAEDEQRVDEYAQELIEKLAAVIGEAIGAEEPAALHTGWWEAPFAVNRRTPTRKGYVIGVNTNGPVDHSVPVLRVTAPDGRLRAVLFGYSCHNTTLGGDFYQINGDYAGQAQAELEQAHPGVTALFVMLCGGDQNPSPRGTTNLARQHGQELAAAVEQVLGTELRAVHPPIRTASEFIKLDLAPHNRQTFEQELESKDKFHQRRARLMLAAYEARQPVRKVSYPVQVIRFGQDLTFLALGGEVVIDYALRAKEEYAGENLVVAGYCNDVMCYIPSKRVLAEGGYEPVESMVYYGLPGPFAPTVEEQIFKSARKLLRRVGAKPGAALPAASSKPL
jgi:neutral ceramidase